MYGIEVNLKKGGHFVRGLWRGLHFLNGNFGIV